MNRKEIDLLLARIEGLKSFLEKNSLEDFQKEILRVDNYLKRFGSLDELLSHLKRVEEVAYTAKEFLTIDEVAYYLQVSKSYVYKLTASREFTVYKPNGKTIFVRRDDLNEWIRRNPCVSGIIGKPIRSTQDRPPIANGPCGTVFLTTTTPRRKPTCKRQSKG